MRLIEIRTRSTVSPRDDRVKNVYHLNTLICCLCQVMIGICWLWFVWIYFIFLFCNSCLLNAVAVGHEFMIVRNLNSNTTWTCPKAIHSTATKLHAFAAPCSRLRFVFFARQSDSHFYICIWINTIIGSMKRRNGDCGKSRKALKRNKSATEGIYWRYISCRHGCIHCWN